MRFGIMAMQLEALVPPGLPAEQIMASIMTFDHAGLAKALADKGFNPIELGGDLGMFMPNAYSPESVEKLAALKSGGLSYTLHLPLWSVEPSTPLTPVRKGSVEALVQTIQATRPIEPEVYVLHATGALAAEFYNMKISEMARMLILRQFQSGARREYPLHPGRDRPPIPPPGHRDHRIPSRLDPRTGRGIRPVRLPGYRPCPGRLPGWFDFFDVLEKLLPRLAEVHLHDLKKMPEGVRGYGEDHKPLGQGDLELGRLLDRLAAANFSGPLVFELNVDEALESLKVIQAVRPQYLVHN